MHTWLRVPMVLGVITGSAYRLTASRFALLARRNLIQCWPTCARIAWLGAVVERAATQDTGV